MATDDVAKGRVTGKAAEQITKNAGKVVAKAGSKSALMSVLGPAGLGLDIAFEIGSIGADMAMDSNVTLKGALQNNWLTGFFMKGTGQEEYHKGLYNFGGLYYSNHQITEINLFSNFRFCINL